MAERFIVANTCEDRCGIQKTDELVDGHVVYRCPGCESRWYDTDAAAPAGHSGVAALRTVKGLTGHLPRLGRRH